MHCNGCGSDAAARIQIGFTKEGKKWEVCDICGKVAASWMPDVYLGGKGGEQSNEQLWDKKNNRPFTYTSKREKAAIMNMLGLSEAGDRNRGSRNEEYLHRKRYI